MKNNYYFLYYFFDNPIIRWLRVLLFFSIGFLVYLNRGNIHFVITILPLYFFLVLQEFFIHFKLEHSAPTKKIDDTYKHIIECVDYPMRSRLERLPRIETVIKEINNSAESRYFRKLLALNPITTEIDIPEVEVLKKAGELVASVKGKYIHSLDIYVSYLLILDGLEKVLFNNEISEQDAMVVYSWVRKEFGLDGHMHTPLRFSGSGVFDFFIYGWSTQLSRVAVNFTREALMRKRARPIGRDDEYDLLVTALSKSSSSNALLVGPAGVGKTTLVTQFAIDSNEGLLPHNIANKTVFQFYAQELISGVDNQGELEERFISIFSELAHAGNIIVYIPNIENIFGGGGLNVDISGALVEYLRSSSIKIIGSTTENAFKEHINNKHEIKELFDMVEVNEPDSDTALFMVLEKAKEFEMTSKVSITFNAVREASSLAGAYSTDGVAMPGAAIHLLDDVIAYSVTHGIGTITKKGVQQFVQEKTHIALDTPSDEESEKLLHLEDLMHKTIVSQNDAVSAIADAMRRVRSGMKTEKRPIASFLFLGPTGVGKTQTAKALAQSYFGDEKTMIRLDMSEYQTVESSERFLGKAGQYGETILDKVANNPFSLVLLDEFEKAYPRILDLFLQILDEGRLTDDTGRTVSFSNCIIIATSNAGSEFVREADNNGVLSENLKSALIEKVQQNGIFKPELINRFDDVIVFKPLTETDVAAVSKLFLDEVIKNAADRQITLTFDEAVPYFIAKHAFSIEFGARNIRRFIEQSVENQLSKRILSHEISRGESARILVEQNALVIRK